MTDPSSSTTRGNAAPWWKRLLILAQAVIEAPLVSASLLVSWDVAVVVDYWRRYDRRLGGRP